VVVGVGADKAPVREYELGRDDAIDRQPVLADEEADPARGREPADADVAVVSGAQRQPVRCERPRDVAPAGAGL
jgi:hypothetical protein